MYVSIDSVLTARVFRCTLAVFYVIIFIAICFLHNFKIFPKSAEKHQNNRIDNCSVIFYVMKRCFGYLQAGKVLLLKYRRIEVKNNFKKIILCM